MSYHEALELTIGVLSILGMGVALLFAMRQRRKLRMAQMHISALEISARQAREKSAIEGAPQPADTNETQSAHYAEQAEQFAAALVEYASILIMAADEEGKLRLFNQKAREITGYDMDDYLAANWLDMFFPGDEFAPARDAMRAKLQGEMVEELIETLLVSKTGEEHTISWQFQKVIHQDQPLCLMFGVDMTERAIAERERHELERKLLDMQKLESLGVLAGGIAHDFNNLLTAILGNAQLARIQMQATSPLRPHLVEIERTSMQAADLCKQMLAYSGQGKIEVRMLDFNQIIRDMSQLLRVSVAKKAQLSFNLAHNLPKVRGDASQIRQVLMNLVINASEAITGNEGSIWVSTGVAHRAKELFRGMNASGQLDEGDYVFIEIADTGCGMSEETQARIFDPFFTTKFTGRGLGLAAVLGIVKGHGGTLELESHVGEGTTFTLLFPCCYAAPEPLNEESKTTSHWSGDGLALVVDDEESVRSLASRMLESFHFSVITAADGREGVAKFAMHADAITAVLLDVTMPVLGGVEALKQMREIRPDVPVLFMSGYMREGELHQLDGGTDFLQKPFQIEELQEKLRVLLSEPHTEEPL